MSTDSDTHSDQEGGQTTTRRTVAHALFRYWRTDAHGPRYKAMAVRGDVIDVEGVDLEVGERHGALVDGDLPTSAAPVPSALLTSEISGGSDPADPNEPDDGIHVGDPAVTLAADPDQPPRPKTVAAKSVWVDYAVGRGMTREEAEALTKDDLLTRFPA